MFKLARALDTLNENFCCYAAYLVLPLPMVVAWEAFMLYVPNAPTSWRF